MMNGGMNWNECFQAPYSMTKNIWKKSSHAKPEQELKQNLVALKVLLFFMLETYLGLI